MGDNKKRVKKNRKTMQKEHSFEEKNFKEKGNKGIVNKDN